MNKMSKECKYIYIILSVEDISYLLMTVPLTLHICSLFGNLSKLTYPSRTTSSRKLSLMFTFPERTGDSFWITMVPYICFYIFAYCPIFNYVFMCLFLPQLELEHRGSLACVSFQTLCWSCPVSSINTMVSRIHPRWPPWSPAPGAMLVNKSHYMANVMDLTHLNRLHYEAKVGKFCRCN